VHLAAIIGLLLIVLAAALRPVNAGAIALAGTFAVGTFIAGEDIRTLNSGFPVDLFVLLFGVTYLFGIASVNGTIQWVVSAVAGILGAQAALVPWAMFLVTASATSAGAPGPAATAMMAPVLLGLSKKYGISSRLAGLMVAHGACAGSFSPINPIGAIVNGTVARSGLPGHPIAVFAANFIYNIVLGLVIYVSFGGVDLLRRRHGSKVVLTANVPDPSTEMNLVRVVTLAASAWRPWVRWYSASTWACSRSWPRSCCICCFRPRVREPRAGLAGPRLCWSAASSPTWRYCSAPAPSRSWVTASPARRRSACFSSATSPRSHPCLPQAPAFWAS
jgi:hypothetical protein